MKKTTEIKNPQSEIDQNGNCIYCGQRCFEGEGCDEYNAGGFTTKQSYVEPVDIQKFYPLHVNHGGHPDNGRIQIGSAKDYIAEMYDDEPYEGEDYITDKESHALADELVKRYNKFPEIAKALQGMIDEYKRGNMYLYQSGRELIKNAKKVLKDAGLE